MQTEAEFNALPDHVRTLSLALIKGEFGQNAPQFIEMFGDYVKMKRTIAKYREDATEYGIALNDAGWTFIEECPEKSALLFNNTKPALRAAILKYLDGCNKELA